MTSSQRILIKEDNYYLATGIENALLQHFSAQPITVHTNVDIAEAPGDLLVISTARLAETMRRKQCLIRLILLAPPSRFRHSLPTTIPIFYCNESVKALIVMAERLLTGSPNFKVSPYSKTLRPHDCSAVLTQRELDVMYFFSLGLSMQQISRLLAVTNKTISVYKRSTMVKLKLHNLAELHRWMQSYFYGIKTHYPA